MKKFQRIGYFLFIMFSFPFFMEAQSVITREHRSEKEDTHKKPDNQKTENKKNNNQVNSSNSTKRTTAPKPAMDFSLAVDLNGERKYITEREWNSMPNTEKAKYNKIGMVIKSGDTRFLISLRNNMVSRTRKREIPFEEAQIRTDGQLPTNRQLKLISGNINRVNQALQNFGGETMSYINTWDREGNPVDVYSGGKTVAGSVKGYYRLSTDDVEGGFRKIEIPSSDGNYDFKGQKPYGYLNVVRKNGKYGYVNKDNKLIVPLKYDEVEGPGGLGIDTARNEDSNWFLGPLISVARNGQWGFVNQSGREVVPTVYDLVKYSGGYGNKPIWVMKNGVYGAVDTLGNLVIPIIYESEISFYDEKPSRVKLNGKWGFIRDDGSTTIPFEYDDTRGFAIYQDLAPVSKNGKYGYIDLNGNVAIPLQYDFADDFSNGYAAVVKNGKLGYIDEKGNVKIPFTFEPSYSNDGNGKTADLSGFRGKVAMVKMNGKYGLINLEGKNLTTFKFDRVKSASSDGDFTVTIGGKDIYLDNQGNEFDSYQARNEFRKNKK